MARLLDERRTSTEKRLRNLQSLLTYGEELCKGAACVYATGSFARGEANPHSDLDLFIVGHSKDNRRALSNLKEILLKAELIEATQKMGIPDFSGDGEYLVHYTCDELVKSLGTPEDDVKNTFTARLLLLLESLPLVGADVYKEIIEDVVLAYWRDYEDHKNDFMPAFPSNDILRMWRTFCVNYEARTLTDPPPKKAKRKLKNYKLKHSRLLTCYSGLLYLLAIYTRKKTVSPTDAMDMISLTPTKRLEWILGDKEFAAAHDLINQLRDIYETFLQQSDASEDEMVKRFMDKQMTKAYFESAYRFGNVMSEALAKIGSGNLFYRLLVV